MVEETTTAVTALRLAAGRARRRAALANRDFLLDRMAYHAAAGHGLGVGDANLDGPRALDRDLLGHADGVVLGLLFLDALAAADLDFFLAHFLLHGAD